MAKRIKYPVGIHTFSEIISGGYLYVDKTELIYDLIDSSKYVFLSRPRRFGKSLLTTTIKSYFEGRKDLFEGLKIAALESKWESHPVFRIDLSPAEYTHPDILREIIESCLENIAKQYSLSLNGPNYSVRFLNLVKDAFEKYGKQVVILIDEYDKPLLDILHEKEIHEEMRAVLRGFYSVIKASDDYIKFAMLTGITRFGKISVFSGINNLRDISLLPKYNGICGITEKEFHDDFSDSVLNFAEENEVPTETVWDVFKKKYDGYHFSDTAEFVYNPFSVLNAFNDARIGAYWYKTGNNKYLIKLIERNHYKLSELEGAVRTEIELSDAADLDYDIVPLLYQSGFLTIKNAYSEYDFDDEAKEYVLGFPNEEVTEVFEHMSGNFIDTTV